MICARWWKSKWLMSQHSRYWWHCLPPTTLWLETCLIYVSIFVISSTSESIPHLYKILPTYYVCHLLSVWTLLCLLCLLYFFILTSFWKTLFTFYINGFTQTEEKWNKLHYSNWCLLYNVAHKSCGIYIFSSHFLGFYFCWSDPFSIVAIQQLQRFLIICCEYTVYKKKTYLFLNRLS